MDERLTPILQWFRSRRWEPFEFQIEAWEGYLNNESGLIHAPTGTGKSLAAWLGPIAEHLSESTPAAEAAPGCRVLWITPMRALASDTVRALEEAARELTPAWTIEKRTGDTPASMKAKQRNRLPSCLVTTPESLSLILSYANASELFADLRCVVVDEWHELLSTKRGTQTELGLARLRQWNPALRTWGLSATIGNLDAALAALLGSEDRAAIGRLISADLDKPIEIEPCLPESVERFPWSGHLGLALLDDVLEALESNPGSTLIFTNTRSQTELWFKAIISARPEWIGEIGIHHGSLDQDLRGGVERLLARGELRCVVCTSSLDLGVDFSPVDQVIQIGSPKGVAKLLQRAGRSGHQPGATSRVLCVPTLAFELIEIAAARSSALARKIEPREPIAKPLDVLAQHLVTIAAGEGFDAPALLDEVRTSWAYRNLSEQEWQWCLDFVEHGGSALEAYPQYARVAQTGTSGRHVIASERMRRQHRLMIGTITSDFPMSVRFSNGAHLGTIEEDFIGRLRNGDRFVFAGRVLELVRVKDMTAYVRRSTRPSGNVPKWHGGRSPISSQLARAVRAKLDEAKAARYDDAEMQLVRPLLELQETMSHLPGPDELLVELVPTEDGRHAFLYPFEGRLVHEGLGALIAYRLSQRAAQSLAVTVNDYGLELVSNLDVPCEERDWRELLSAANLLDDLMACLNTTQLTRRRFRDVARIAGLIFPGYPSRGGSGRNGQGRKPARHLQASSELFFDVFSEFDPDNQLLAQARREVLSEQLEVSRLRRALEAIESQRMVLKRSETLTPFGFPIWAESLRTQHVSSERWSDRVAKMSMRLEKEARKQDRRKEAHQV